MFCISGLEGRPISAQGEALGTLIISLPCALEGQHRFWICYLKE